jgi:hypothetical protein
MEHGACNIIYLDRRAREELFRRETVLATRASTASEPAEYFKLDEPQMPVEVQANIESILSTFNEGMQVWCPLRVPVTNVMSSSRMPIGRIVHFQIDRTPKGRHPHHRPHRHPVR